MAYIKVVPIKVTVKKALKYAMNEEKIKIEKDKDIINELNYVMNKEKTTYQDELDKEIKQTLDYDVNDNNREIILSSGINCVSNPEIAYMQFNLVYQKYPEKLSWGKDKNNSSTKQSIKAHHFIQSFKKGEIDPVKAHELGKELCNRAFKNNHQIIISTHVDKDHVHNHIVVNAIGLDGKKFYSNKESLMNIRSIGDEICRENNLYVIKKEDYKDKPKNNFHYKEWMERKKGTSWKQKIQLDIDKLVIKVNSLEELIRELRKQGYTVVESSERNKYLKVKPPEKERFVRTKTLGEEYTEEALIRRINEKDKEKPIVEKFKDKSYKGIQKDYNDTLHKLGIMIIRGEKKDYKRYDSKKPYSIKNDFHVNILANQLYYLNKNNIESELDLKEKYKAVQEQYITVRKKVQDLNKVVITLKSVNEEINVYKELAHKENKTQADLIRLQSCKNTFAKYNIKTETDIKKYQAAYEKANKEIELLNEQMKEAKELNKTIKEIIDTYEKIQRNTYLESLKQQVKTHDKELEK